MAAAAEVKERIFLSFPLLFYSSPQWIGRHPYALSRGILLLESTDSNANLFRKCPHGDTQSVLPVPWPSLSPFKLSQKIKHHRGTEEGKWVGLAHVVSWVSYQGL